MFITVNIDKQTLNLSDNSFNCAISSAKNGVGERQASECTPRGWHEICAKFGDGLAPNAILKARQATGQLLTEQLQRQSPGADFITARILWLSGLDFKLNWGQGVDSKARFIYIHGCADDQPMGVATSHGCIRMRHADIIKLYPLVPLFTRVLIEA